MNSEPIFILGAHKSGTSLLRSILDGHSKLYAIPFESHYFQLKGYWVDNEYRKKKPKSLNSEETINNFVKWIKKSNVEESEYIDAVSKGIFEVERFKEHFSQTKNLTDDKDCLEKYFESIYYSVEGKNISDNLRIVEKSVEHAEFALELSNFFPKAKFIHIIRNPYANLVSLRKFKSIKYGYPIIRRVLKTLYNNYYFLYKNNRLIKNYKIIRYEDLVSSPESTVNEICEFLDIKFEPILLKPTYLEKLWVGNSMTNKKFVKISSERLGKWKENIYPMEIFYVNKLFEFIITKYNYKMFNSSGSFWKWNKGENPKRYFANRIYKFLIT